jgi:hypothetical protein
MLIHGVYKLTFLRFQRHTTLRYQSPTEYEAHRAVCNQLFMGRKVNPQSNRDGPDVLKYDKSSKRIKVFVWDDFCLNGKTL